MAGHAEVAAVVGGGHQLHHFTLGQAQLGLAVECRHSDVGFQRRRGVGQHAEQVGDEARGLLGVLQIRTDGLRGALQCMDSDARHWSGLLQTGGVRQVCWL
ncbi:hypothetical protein D9M71_753660 [compost metagenome]